MTNIDLIFIGAGAISLLVGIICAFVAARSEDRLAAIEDTPTSSAADVEAICRRNGAYGQACEVAGTIECDYSLSGPLTGEPCAAYSYMQAWEEWGPAQMWERRHSNDGMVRRNGGTDFDDRRVPTFWVRDASGRIMVDPINAELDLQEIDQRYDVTTSSFGGAERRVRHVERALPLGQVYVLGYLAERAGQPVIQRHPSDPAKKFLISYRSEQKLVGTHRLRSYGYYFAAGITGSLGLLLLLWRLLIARGRI
jgi:hypothetical protein